MASDSESGGPSDPYSDATAKYGPLKLPVLQPIDLNKVYGTQRKEPDYLDYDIKGRSVWEAAPYNAGAFYIAGILGGGLYGVREGIAKAPNRRRRVLMNSVMNAAGKRGAMYGNTLAVLAAYYTSAHAIYDYVEIDQNRFVHQAGLSGCINQVLAGASTGLLYKSLAGPRVAGIAAAAGVGAVGLGFAADYAASSVFGRGFIFE